MRLKDLVAIADVEGEQKAARVAIDLAAKDDGHVTSVCIAFQPIVPGFVAAPMPADYLSELREQAVASAETAARKIADIARRSGVSSEERVVELLSGGTLDALLASANLCDLAVVGQDNPDRPEPMREAIIEALLFDTGVPVLVVPYTNTSVAFDHIVIAWDGSATAAKAARAALPLLPRARRLTVLVIEKAGARRSVSAGEPGAEVATYLARHGLEVTIDTVTGTPISIADTMLNYVSDHGVDLIVMGGYGHSRLREFVFGGATREILTSMTAPILMAH